MTREEAIKYGTEWLKDEYLDAKDGAFITIALETLEQEPCIREKQANADKIDVVYIDGFKAGYSQARFDLEQETCEDCVSRNDAMIQLSHNFKQSSETPNEETERAEQVARECCDPFPCPYIGRYETCAECGYMCDDYWNED